MYSYLASTAVNRELSINCIFLKIKAVASSALENRYEVAFGNM